MGSTIKWGIILATGAVMGLMGGVVLGVAGVGTEYYLRKRAETDAEAAALLQALNK